MRNAIIDLSHGSTNPYKSAASSYQYSIRNVCPFCHDYNLILLDGAEYFNHFQRGEYIQVAFPSLTSDERELILNGTHPECWDEYMGSDNDEDYWDADPVEDYAFTAEVNEPV